MKKYLFTILMVVSVAIAIPGMWMKILAPQKSGYELEESWEETEAGELADAGDGQPAETEVPSEEVPAETEVPSEEVPTEEDLAPADGQPAETEAPSAEVPSDEVSRTFTEVDRSYWADALFIGDSRTVGLSEYADLGGADVFATSGMSVYKIFSTEVNVDGTGKKTLEEVLTSRQYGKIYIMMGINELGYDHHKTVEKYEQLVNRVQELQPQAVVFLGANLHVTQKKSDSDSIYNNAAIDRLNQAILGMANQKTRFYVDVNEIFDDGQGNLDVSYTADESHVLGKYYATWADWLLTKGIQ